MTVAELIKLLETFPPDAEVVVPHVWEKDDQRCWPADADNVELTTATPLLGGGFNPTGGDRQIVLIG